MNEKLQAVTANQAKVPRKRNASAPTLPDQAFVRLPVVLLLLGVSRSTVWRLCKSGALPAPKKLGSRIAVWQVKDLREVLNSGSLWTHSASA